MGIFAIVGVMFKWLIATFVFFLILGIIVSIFSGIASAWNWFVEKTDFRI